LGVGATLERVGSSLTLAFPSLVLASVADGIRVFMPFWWSVVSDAMPPEPLPCFAMIAP
jgi:hypothetical protein